MSRSDIFRAAFALEERLHAVECKLGRIRSLLLGEDGETISAAGAAFITEALARGLTVPKIASLMGVYSDSLQAAIDQTKNEPTE